MTGEEIRGLIGIIILCAFFIGVIIVSIICIIKSWHSNSFKEIKKLVEENKDIDPFYMEYLYKREKPQVEKLFAEHNYKLIDKKIVEPRTIHGCGEIKFADGRRQYNVYFSDIHSATIEKEIYDKLKKELGKTANFVSYEKVYTNKEE